MITNYTILTDLIAQYGVCMFQGGIFHENGMEEQEQAFKDKAHEIYHRAKNIISEMEGAND